MGLILDKEIHWNTSRCFH